MIIKKEYLKNKSRCKITFPAQKELAGDAVLTIRKQYLKNKSQCRITFPAQKEVADGAKEMKFKITY